MKQKEDNHRQARFILVLLMSLNAFYLNAQNLIDKTISATSEYIFIELNFIENLKIVNSEGNKIEVITQNNFGGSSNFVLKEEKGSVTIKDLRNYQEHKEEIDKNCVVQPVYPSYLIKVPEEKQVRIMITEGNLNVNNYRGRLLIELERGIAKLEDFHGSIDMHINVGNVYCKLKDTEMDIHTNLGFIRWGDDFSKKSSDFKMYKGRIGKPYNKLNISALKANIYIEKIN